MTPSDPPSPSPPWALLAGGLAVVTAIGVIAFRSSSSSSAGDAQPAEPPPHPEPELSPERRAVVDEAFGMLGLPYQWGGGHAPGGYGVDCSGLVIRALQRAGQPLPPCPGATSDAWWHCLERIDDPIPGDLALYGRPERAIHVEMVTRFYGDHAETIGAIGNRDVTSPEIAHQRNANVRLASTAGRSNFLGFVRNPIEDQAARQAHRLVDTHVSLDLQPDEA